MEKKHIMVLIACIVSVLSVMSVLTCVKAFAFNEMFVAYQQAIDMYRAHGTPYPQFENVTYYSIGLTKNRTDLLLRNIGNAQFNVSSVRWCPSEQMQRYESLLRLAPVEYSMDPSSGIIQPNSRLLITVEWGVPGGNVSESEWSSNKSYFWEISNSKYYNFGATVRPGEDLSRQAAEQAAAYRELQVKSEISGQSTYAEVLAQKWVIMSEMYILVPFSVVAAFVSVYMASRFRLGMRQIFEKHTIVLIMWMVLSAPVLFTASVVLHEVRNGMQFISSVDFWQRWYWAALGGMEPYFLGLWIVVCAWGALFIYLLFNYRRRAAIPFYRSLCISLLSAAFLISAFTVTLPLTDSVITTFVQTSEAAIMGIVAAFAVLPAPILKKVKMRFGGVRERWKTRVNITNSDVAIALGGIALLMSIGYPLVNYLVAARATSGEPSLSVSMRVSAYYTNIELSNVGGRTSRNIRLELVYEGHGFPAIVNVRATEFVPKLEKGNTVAVNVPVGRSILLEQSPDLSRYTAVIRVESDETPVQSFDFNPFLAIPPSS